MMSPRVFDLANLLLRLVPFGSLSWITTKVDGSSLSDGSSGTTSEAF